MFSYSKSLKLSLANSKGSINTAIKGLKCKSRYSKNSSVSAPGSAEYARPPPPSSPRGEAGAFSLNWLSQTTRAAEGTLGLRQETAHLLPTAARARALCTHTTLPLAAPCPHLTRNTRPQQCPGPASGAQSPQSSRQARENRKAMVCAIKMLPADMEGNTTPQLRSSWQTEVGQQRFWRSFFFPLNDFHPQGFRILNKLKK